MLGHISTKSLYRWSAFLTLAATMYFNSAISSRDGDKQVIFRYLRHDTKSAKYAQVGCSFEDVH